MSRMSLSVTHIASGDLWAGAEVQLYMLARAQHQLGNHVTVVLLNPGALAERLEREGITVHVLPETSLSTPAIFIAMRRLLQRIKPDIVHTHRHKENILGGLAAWLNDIPSLRTVHGAPETHYGRQRPGQRIMRFLDHWTGRYLQQRIVAVTHDLTGKLGKEFPRAQLTTIENGIDPEAFTSFAAGETFSPGFAAARRRIGIVGRLVPVKRIDLFIATARLLTEDPELQDIHFFVLGDGPLHATLAGQAMPLRDRLTFLGTIERIHPYIAAMDALLMCSDHEGLPITALEAMSLNCPLVAHQVGGLIDLLDRGRCGWPVTEQSPEAYAAAIRSVLGDSHQRTAVLARAKERVSTRHTAKLCAERYLAAYHSCLPAHGPNKVKM
jgi:glycosyltransferase involved in cell wall biosynthesis